MSEITKFILESIENADGNFEQYSEVVKENKDDYRTLEHYISSRADKQELAERLGLTSTRALDAWGIKGIKFQRAMQCAIALKLSLEEANEFFKKYAGMRSLYPASEEDFRHIYVLIYRERLEKQFPYEKKESVKEWMKRIIPQIEFLNQVKFVSEENKNTDTVDQRMPTDKFLDILMEQNLEVLPKIKFRSAGEKALAYLDELVTDTPYEKNYGNRSAKSEITENVNDRNGSIRLDLYYEEEKGHYDLIRRKLKNGDIPHRDELIQFAMDMNLGLEIEKVNELLVKSGYEPLMARNIYEGLLITIYLYEEGNISADANDSKNSLDYLDFQVFVSEKVDEALSYLPKDENLLKEVPQWYLNETERRERLEKRCFSDMITLISDRMTRTWKNMNRNLPVNISDSTLRKAAHKQMSELKNQYMDPATYQAVYHMVCRTEKRWVEILKNGVLKDMNRKSYIELFDEILKELDNYYRSVYALKKMKNDKKGQKGGREKNEKRDVE